MIRRTHGQHLRSVELFSDCSPAQLATADTLTTQLCLEQGHVLLREGERDRQFMVITEGLVGVSREGGEPVAILEPGDFVGEVAMLNGGPRSATVTALTPVEILVCNAPEFYALIDSAPSVAEKITRAAATRIAANLLADAA